MVKGKTSAVAKRKVTTFYNNLGWTKVSEKKSTYKTKNGVTRACKDMVFKNPENPEQAVTMRIGKERFWKLS
jgi:hypothetical protein